MLVRASSPLRRHTIPVLLGIVVLVVGVMGVRAVETPAQEYVVPTAPSADRDRDGTADLADACPATPGDQANGCPRRLSADVRGMWRANALYSQLVSLTVRAPTGSRIAVRCRGARACGFSSRTIDRTTKELTGLTRYFRGRRVLPAGTIITVRVTRARQIGHYESVTTRRGRHLPRVVNRCISPRGIVQRCPAR